MSLRLKGLEVLKRIEDGKGSGSGGAIRVYRTPIFAHKSVRGVVHANTDEVPKQFV